MPSKFKGYRRGLLNLLNWCQNFRLWVLGSQQDIAEHRARLLAFEVNCSEIHLMDIPMETMDKQKKPAYLYQKVKYPILPELVYFNFLYMCLLRIPFHSYVVISTVRYRF